MRYGLLAVTLLSMAGAVVSAAEIRGQIAAVDEQGVAVVVSGNFEPQPGDKFVVTVEVPGVGEASIAQGQVNVLDEGIVLGKIVSSTGKVAVGQKVKIDSPQAVQKRALLTASPAAIRGQIGAVVDKEITIVTTSKVDPAVGDKVEVYVDGPVTGPARVGVGKVAAVQNGLITALIEQATGPIAFGQPVQIISAQAQPEAGSPAASVSGGEVLGLKLDPVDAGVAELLDLPKAAGLLVRSVAPNSPAETAGVKKRDVLLRAAGAELNDLEAFRAATASGGELRVELWRNGAAQTVVLALPVPATSATPATTPSSPEAATPAVWIGLVIENFRDDVRVNGVIPGSPAARAGFHAGDRLLTLDAEEVVDYQLFTRAVSSGAAGKVRRIVVARGEQRLTIDLMPEPRPTSEQLFARIKKLAEAGDHDAEYEVGMMYQDGRGVPDRDLAAASKWLLKAATAGEARAQSEYGAFLMLGKGVEKNPTEGLNWARKAADQGYPTAVRNMGIAYHHGIGTNKDEAEARRWFKLGLDQGSLKTLVHLGQLYEEGDLYEKDLKQAAEFYRTAAHRGYSTAASEWGRCLLDGVGVEQDRLSAVKWIKLASDAGDPRAQFIFARMYLDGLGVPQDHAVALEWFRKAAALGNTSAMFNLGWAFSSGSMGVKIDDAEAARWYRAAADLGRVDAYIELGVLYEYGRGVPQSDEQAVVWHRKAAEANLAMGQYNLANMYSRGRGVEQSDAEALNWYHKAALQKNSLAEFQMGVIAMEGRIVQKDFKTAFGWFMNSAKQGYAPAQHNLGVLYENGQGVAANQAEAIKWYQRAAQQNQPESIEALKRLGAR